MRLLVVALVLLAAACASEPFFTQDGSPAADTSEPPKLDGYVWPDGVFRVDSKICGEQAFSMTRTIPDVLIVLDRSNSMAEASGGQPALWTSCRNAIYGITSSMESSIWFGLFVFPSTAPPLACDFLPFGECTAPTAPMVEVGAKKAADIKAALVNLLTCGGTPTADTLTQAQAYLGKLTNKHPQYILLATDGGPNCNSDLDGATCTCVASNCDLNNQNCLDDVRTHQALDKLCAAGIKTYVIGMGGAQTLTGVLQGMAQHGCTNQPYAPTDAAGITQAFKDISQEVASCAFEIDCTKIEDVNLVNFYFDGAVVKRNKAHTGGWDWTTQCKSGQGKGTIEFFGADCDSIKNDAVKNVSAKYGCATSID